MVVEIGKIVKRNDCIAVALREGEGGVNKKVEKGRDALRDLWTALYQRTLYVQRFLKRGI